MLETTIFESTIFESMSGGAPRRTAATVASFALETVGLGIVLLIPILYPEALPALRIGEPITAPTAPRQPDAIQVIASEPAQHRRAVAIDNAFRAPSSIPDKTSMTPDPPAERTAGSLGIPGGIPSTGDAVDNPLLRELARAVPPPLPPRRERPQRIRVSVLDEGAVIKKVQPVYPMPAKMARIEGPVVLTAIISNQGEVLRLQAIRGNPLLIGAALDAVRQWRYRPYLLNGQPIEVETQITVVFTLR